MGILYVIGTPIGNLEDLTQRAARAIQESSIVIAEDTRVTKKLLSHLGAQKKTIRFDENSGEDKARAIVNQIGNETWSYITDAGTPNISDPGWQLVRSAIQKDVKVVPIPGASSLTAAISISHFPIHPFVFWGFPPHKKGRETFFKNVSIESKAQILFESPHRIDKTLEVLSRIIPNREIVVAKELTKVHERIFRGGANDVYKELEGLSASDKRGEFVIIVSPAKYGQK